jgi:hypothetical protein
MNGAPMMGWSGWEGYPPKMGQRIQRWTIRVWLRWGFCGGTVGHGWMAVDGMDPKIELFSDVHDRTI